MTDVSIGTYAIKSYQSRFAVFHDSPGRAGGFPLFVGTKKDCTAYAKAMNKRQAGYALIEEASEVLSKLIK